MQITFVFFPMKSVAARGRASSNRGSYKGAGLCSVWAGPNWMEPPVSVKRLGGVKQREMEQGGGRRTGPDESSSRPGVEVRSTGWEEELEEVEEEVEVVEEEGSCCEETSGGTQRNMRCG